MFSLICIYILFMIFFYLLFLHSFPTRRSSDLIYFSLPIAIAGGVVSVLLGLRLMSGKTIKSIANIEYTRSEEHTSELQSRGHLVCRLLLEKKKNLSNGTE